MMRINLYQPVVRTDMACIAWVPELPDLWCDVFVLPLQAAEESLRGWDHS